MVNNKNIKQLQSELSLTIKLMQSVNNKEEYQQLERDASNIITELDKIKPIKKK